MATYKYQQILQNGAAEGYVKYDISPDFGTPLKAGDVIEINGEMFCRNFDVGGIWLFVDAGNSSQILGQSSQTAQKGRTATFRITSAVTQDIADQLAEKVNDTFINFGFLNSENQTVNTLTIRDTSQKIKIIKYLQPPTITNLTVSDKADLFSKYNGFISGKSKPYIIVLFSLESSYPTQLKTASVTLDNETLPFTITNQGSSYVTLEMPDPIETIADSAVLKVELTDTNNNTAAKEYGTPITVYEYYEPKISQLSMDDGLLPFARRYNYTVNDDGSQKVDYTPDGIHVRLSCLIKVAPVSPTWTIYTYYALENNTEFTMAALFQHDGDYEYPYINSKRLMPDTIVFDINSSYTIRIVVKDALGGETTIETKVEKASAYLNVKRYGLSIGMRSTATPETPKLESAYAAYMYQGIVGLTCFDETEQQAGRSLDGKQLYSKTLLRMVTDQNTINIPITKLGEVYRIDGVLTALNKSVWPVNCYINPDTYCACYRPGAARYLALTAKGMEGIATITVLYSKANTEDPTAVYLWNEGAVSPYNWESNGFPRPAYPGTAVGEIGTNTLNIKLPAVTGNNSIPFNAHVSTTSIVTIPPQATKLSISAKKTTATATYLNFGLLKYNAPNSYSTAEGGQLLGDTALSTSETVYTLELDPALASVVGLKCVINGKANLKLGITAAGVVINKVWFE